jgi:hypothetical protein
VVDQTTFAFSTRARNALPKVPKLRVGWVGFRIAQAYPTMLIGLRINGVTIQNGAQFSFSAVANKRLHGGQVFTAISNTSASPIAGTFANLADGSTFVAGRNSFKVSYSGGDGNDLTLTVVP